MHLRTQQVEPCTIRLYVALAVRLNTRSITADERLEAALKSIPAVADHIQLVQIVRA